MGELQAGGHALTQVGVDLLVAGMHFEDADAALQAAAGARHTPSDQRSARGSTSDGVGRADQVADCRRPPARAARPAHTPRTRLDVWQGQVHDAVKAAGAGERLVECRGAVGGCHHNHTGVVLEAVQLCSPNK